MKKFLVLTIAALAFTAGVASAQANFGSYTRTETGVVGQVCVGWNASADTVIVEGDLVSFDTTSTVKRIAVRKLGITNITRLQFLGIAVDRIAAGTGNSGRILLWGYHPRACVAVSGATARQQLKYSLTVPGSFSLADTVGSIAAVILGGNSTVFSGTRYKYKVWLYPGLRVAGATL